MCFFTLFYVFYCKCYRPNSARACRYRKRVLQCQHTVVFCTGPVAYNDFAKCIIKCTTWYQRNNRGYKKQRCRCLLYTGYYLAVKRAKGRCQKARQKYTVKSIITNKVKSPSNKTAYCRTCKILLFKSEKQRKAKRT